MIKQVNLIFVWCLFMSFLHPCSILPETPHGFVLFCCFKCQNVLQSNSQTGVHTDTTETNCKLCQGQSSSSKKPFKNTLTDVLATWRQYINSYSLHNTKIFDRNTCYKVLCQHLPVYIFVLVAYCYTYHHYVLQLRVTNDRLLYYQSYSTENRSNCLGHQVIYPRTRVSFQHDVNSKFKHQWHNKQEWVDETFRFHTQTLLSCSWPQCLYGLKVSCYCYSPSNPWISCSSVPFNSDLHACWCYFQMCYHIDKKVITSTIYNYRTF